jgi:hypothetical protein
MSKMESVELNVKLEDVEGAKTQEEKQKKILSIFDFQNRHYNVIWDEKRGKSYYKCRYCGIERRTEESMYLHIIKIHFGGNVKKAWGEI